MPYLTMLIGLPGSGKTSWRRQACARDEHLCVISSDDHIEDLAHRQKISYAEAFRSVDIARYTAETLIPLYHAALRDGRNIIIDRTNLTARSRSQWLDTQPARDLLRARNYSIHGIIFDPPLDLIRERNRMRQKMGRQIPEAILENMIRSCETPGRSEAFDSVIRIPEKAIRQGRQAAENDSRQL